MCEKKLPHHHGQKTAQILTDCPSAQDFSELSQLLRQLGDGSRLRLFWILCHCEECVTNLSAMMNMSNPAVSHHLKQLRTSGLITSRRDGKEVYYQASDTVQAALFHQLMEQLIPHVCPNPTNRPEERGEPHDRKSDVCH